MNHLKNKVIWLTGASSGIGEATAKLLSTFPIKLILSSRREEDLQRVKNECNDPDKIAILPIDLAENKNAATWVEEALQLFGSIDILINNAGVGQWGKAIDTSEEIERKIFEVNYFGPIALTKALLPYFLKNKKGQIISVSSLAGQFGQAQLSSYSAAKGALLLYYESLKEELIDKPVKIQVVSPGFINTNVMFNSLTASGEKYDRNGPAQENGMPASDFAKKLVKVINGNKFHTFIGKKEILAVPLHFFFPKLFYKLVRK